MDKNNENNNETTNSKVNDFVPKKVISKHKQRGKHSLNHDSIFKGKKGEELKEDYTEHYFNDSFTYDPQSHYYHETMNNDEYVKEKLVKEKIYEVLIDKTELNFMTNRRKPSEVDFNKYFELLIEELKDESFSYTEIFNELSFYFSDKSLNMYKLLNKKYRDLILVELKDYIGQTPDKKTLVPKNLKLGTEIEFEIEDDSETIIYSGKITNIDHDKNEYDVDSFEHIYIVPFECITKILKQKEKYNLNKLDNLDII